MAVRLSRRSAGMALIAACSALARTPRALDPRPRSAEPAGLSREDPREIGLDRRKSRRRHSKTKVAVGADEAKGRLVAAKTRVGCPRRVDQQIGDRFTRGRIRRHDKGFDMGAKGSRDMARHLQKLA